MPGVSGDEKVQRPAMPGAIRGGMAKLPGFVPAAVVDGFWPKGGSWKERAAADVSRFIIENILLG
jgi:hypothetical protein